MRSHVQNKLVLTLATILVALIVPYPGYVMHSNVWPADLLVVIMYFAFGALGDKNSIISHTVDNKQVFFGQSISYLIGSALGFSLYVISSIFVDKESLIGILFISLLCAPMFSAMSFTMHWNGNLILARKNVMISQFIALICCPIVMSVVVENDLGIKEDLLRVYFMALWKMYLPFVVGLKVSKYRDKMKKTIKFISSYFIYFYIYSIIGYGICCGFLIDSVKALLIPLITLCVYGVLIEFIIIDLSKLYNWNIKDRISLLFTSSLKSLAFGAPIVHSFFYTEHELVFKTVLLILFYYVFSMFLTDFMVKKFMTKESNRVFSLRA